MGEDVATQYAALLADLRINSKPVINGLTMIAEDHIRQAPVVVQTIEKHLNRVHANVKLPVLYLIDSIIKNVKKDYVSLFTQNIVSTFCGTFEKVDEKTKSQMFKLRQTWNDHIVPKKLYAIDLRCRELDPNWPVTASQPAASIHVNPKFLNRPIQQTPKTSPVVTRTAPVAVMPTITPPETSAAAGDLTEAQMREQLLMKQKELLELQQKKLELELLQTKAKLEEEQNRKQIEATYKQQQQLMQQAEMAKHQTGVAASIIALAGPTASFPVTSQGFVKPTAMSAHETFAHDPRISRQPNSGEKSSKVSGSSPQSIAMKAEYKASNVLTQNQKQKFYTDSAAAVLPRISGTVAYVPELHGKQINPAKVESSIQDMYPRHGSPPFEKDKDFSHLQGKKRHHEISEINLFEKSHPKEKDMKKEKDKGRDKKSRESSRSSRDKCQDRRSRDRSRSSEGRKSKEKRKPAVKKERTESEDDYEDEMKGYSALTIKPRRSDLVVSPSERKGSSSSGKSISPVPTSHSGQSVAPKKEKDSLSVKDKSRMNSSPKERHVSPVPNNLLGKKFDSSQGGVVENNGIKSSPSLSATSSMSGGNGNSVSAGESSTSNEGSPTKKSKKVSVDEKDSKKDRQKDKHSRKDKDKSRYSKEKDSKDRRKKTPWNDYNERKSAVLGRNYRKKAGVDAEEEEESSDSGKKTGVAASSVSGDVDLRIDGLKDVDLRTETEYTEPPLKKSRPNSTTSNSTGAFGNSGNLIDDWSQVKKPSVSSDNDVVAPERQQQQPPHEHDEDIREIIQRQNRNRPPPPISPANSVGSNRSSCDPLGRPLLYNRLPDDPEERKRSLDTRSSSIDPVERFRTQYIDRPMHASGELTQTDVKNAFVRAKEEVELGLLNTEQFQTVMKQLTQINEVNKIREVQMQQQMRGANWQAPAPAPGPNPWTEAENVWAAASFAPRGPNDFAAMNRFPAPTGPNTWQQPSTMTPWGPSAVIPSGPRGPNPFEEAMPPAIIDNDFIPVANPIEVRVIERDSANVIPLDNINRQIRFYGEAAIVLMGMMCEEPREISFQRENRTKTVLINGKTMECMIGELKYFELNRKQHTLKLGAPTRELYIDKLPYEALFGGPPVRISLDGRFHTFQLKGPPPQVEVGKKPRFDLLAGRVNLIVDGNSVPIYLDEKPQLLDLRGLPVVLRFTEDFHSVTLNGRPFRTNFGARLPFSITVPGGGKHFLRFSALTPATEEAMRTYVRIKHNGPNMMEENSSNHFRGRGGHMMRGRGRGMESMRGRPPIGPPGGMPPPRHGLLPDPHLSAMEQQPTFESNPLDMLVNFFPPSDMNKPMDKRKKDRSYETETSLVEEDTSGKEEKSNENRPDENSGSVNVLDLLAKLMSAGPLPATSTSSAEGEKKESSDSSTEASKSEKMESGDKNEVSMEKDNAKPVDVIAQPEKPIETKPVIPPLETVDIMFGENLKERRDKVVDQICTGVQCGSCGLRFAPDQTIRYSQHLDWHFRQNRREKANFRKAQSRKWYYDLSDWIQFEEIEDLEERAASIFESPDDDGDNKSPSVALNPEECTVLAKGHEGVICPQCGENFENFYDEDKEEWRLLNAILDEMDGETKLYHTLCHQDYLKSLVEESIIEMPNEEEEENESEPRSEIEDVLIVPDGDDDDDDEVLILKEGKKEIVVMEIDVDDEDIVKERRKSETLLVDNNILNTEKNDELSLLEKEKNNENEIAKIVVPSPIVIHDIDEDSSSFLPGISDHTEEGVFQFALNEGRSRGNVSPSPTPEEKRIVYESMKFDFPRTVKLEPEDELEQPMEIDPFVASKDPLVVDLEGHSLPTIDIVIEPENIDLTVDDDSMDEVDSGFVGAVAEIDGNTQDTGPTQMPFVPAQKIRINISGVDISSNSPSRKGEDSDAHKDTSPAGVDSNENISEKVSSPMSSDESKVSSDNNVFTEEMKRLKPRLVGRKLVNCPPKNTGKEESGLCTIC